MAITDSLVQTAMRHLRAGHPAEAAKICRDIIRLEPEHARAYCLLAMITFQDGDSAGALAMLEHAGRLNDRLPDVPRALAEVQVAMGNLEAALEAQMLATRFNPREPAGHLQEAVLLGRLGRKDEAETAVRRTLTLKPDALGGRQLLASLLYERGEIAEATGLLLAVRRLPQPGADPNHYLGLCLFAQDRIGEIAGLPPAPEANQGFGEHILAAVAAWLAGDLATCRAAIAAADDGGTGGPTDAPNRQTFLTYRGILEGLLAWRRDNPERYGDDAARTIHVMGDSHSLTAANMVLQLDGKATRFDSHLVYGCKAWHLVREEPSPFRSFFELAADRLPAGATVIGAFGELDIRFRRGIMHALRKDRTADWRAMTDDLVTRYVDFMAQTAAARGWDLWLASPPMTNLNTTLMARDERTTFLGIIARFNERLREHAAARAIRLVDLHGVTSDGRGGARHTHYIDTNHVRPPALIEALGAARSTSSR